MRCTCPFAAVAPDLFTLTFNGLSKAYRVAGFRAGWLLVHGPKRTPASYLEGLAILANMRLCANVPAQHAIQVALGGRQSIHDLVLPGGRLREQRDAAMGALRAIPGVSCVEPAGRVVRVPAPGPGDATRSRTTSSSSWSCCASSTCCWCRAAASTGRIRTTCGSSRCPVPTT